MLQPFIHRIPRERWLLCPSRSAGISYSILHNFPFIPSPREIKVPTFSSLFLPVSLHLASLLINPLLLHEIPVGVGEASVVGQGSQPLLLQDGCCGVTLVPGKAIDYPRVICKSMAKEISAAVQFYSLFPLNSQTCQADTDLSPLE